MVGHVKAFEGKVNGSVLLLLHAFEALEVDYQNGRSLENLELFDSLLVHFAPTTEPSVLIRQFLRCHELSETVIDSHFVVLRLILSRSSLFWKRLHKKSRADQVFIQRPTLVRIERHL